MCLTPPAFLGDGGVLRRKLRVQCPRAASRYLTARNVGGGTAFTYHSKRSNTRATHSQCCPRQPRPSSHGHLAGTISLSGESARPARVPLSPARRRLPASDLRSNQSVLGGLTRGVFGGLSTLRSETATEDGPNTAGQRPTLPESTASFPLT